MTGVTVSAWRRGAGDSWQRLRRTALTVAGDLRRGLGGGHSVTALTAMAVFVVLIAVLALIPTGVPVNRDTVSTYAFTPYRWLLQVALLAMALASLLVARRLRRVLGRGRAGVAVALFPVVWAAASVVDAFLPTDPTGVHTPHGEVHIDAAVTAMGALALAAVTLAAVLRHRRVRMPLLLTAATMWALLACAYQIGVTEGHASTSGLAERLLLLSCIGWMAAVIRCLAPVRPDTAVTSAASSGDGAPSHASTRPLGRAKIAQATRAEVRARRQGHGVSLPAGLVMPDPGDSRGLPDGELPTSDSDGAARHHRTPAAGRRCHG